MTFEEMMKLKPMQRFWYCWRMLKKDFPISKKVVVRTKDKCFLYGHRVYGYCKYSEKTETFTLTIERNKDAGIMVDTLRHEYAHAMTWTVATRTHCKKFWAAYAKIYRRYLDGEKT